MSENQGPSRVPYTVEVVKAKHGNTLFLGDDDKVFHAGTRDDLSVGGTWHTFVILSPETPRKGSQP
jgi:hypothetical protein